MNFPVYPLVFGSLLTLLVLVILAAFTLSGILAWSIGLLYITYDSFLFFLIVSIVARVLKKDAAELQNHSAAGARPSLAVVIPARNEQSVLPSCLEAVFRQTDAPEEIFIVDDGSTDGTVAWLREKFALTFVGPQGNSSVQPNLVVLRNPHQGKADSLNSGWRAARSDIVVTLDADTIPEPDALAHVRRAFAENPNLAAGGGVLVPRCGGGFLGRVFEFYQTFEYMRSFLDRFAWMSLQMLVLISGAFSAFRRDVLRELGGFNPQSQVEDYELIYRLYRHSHDRGLELQVHVISGARAMTDAPATPAKFLSQRTRWFAGFLATLFQNKDMVGKPRYGRFGKWMLLIKLVDTLKPIYGFLALIIFLTFLILGYHPYLTIIYVLIAKAVFDLFYHCRAFLLYHRWLGIRQSPRLWAKSVLAALTEPLAFQILRQVGAATGWMAYLRGRIGWAPQRPVLK